VVAVGAGENLAAQIIGGPRDNLVTGQTVEFYATVSPAGQLVTYEWRVNGGAVMSTAAWYSHYFQGPATISLTVTSSAGQTAYATAEVSGSGTQFRIQRTQPKSSGRP
jgi:predicted phage tail protein